MCTTVTHMPPFLVLTLSGDRQHLPCWRLEDRRPTAQDLVGHAKEASKKCGPCLLGKGWHGGHAWLHSKKIIPSTIWETNWRRQDQRQRGLLGGCLEVQDISYHFNSSSVHMPDPHLRASPDHRLSPRSCNFPKLFLKWHLS